MTAPSRRGRGQGHGRASTGATPSAPPVAPPQPPHEDITPRKPWPPHLRDTGNGADLRAELMSIDYLLYGPSTHDRLPYVLPPWQRGQVWTPAQQVAFCETVWDGMPFQPVLLWQRDYRAPPVVLDGQQRLTALGAHVLRADGTENAPTAAHLDLETGRWQVGPAEGHPPITMAQAANVGWLLRLYNSATLREDPSHWRTASLVAQASERLRGGRSFVFTIGAGVPIEDVIRIFRTWNTPGVPIPPDEIEALILAADRSWRPPDPPATPASDDPGSSRRG